ncbi:carbonic anhydrase [Actinoplanes sp. RD1]|uniref:carbonic anhydrase n=1 Tax=Actinoplanes sp. RD1 TaxID=3064538 RepID=UPI00274254E4|nr:carbonic anhydrase [Actinoplanes sp. RD1]
MPKQTPWSKLRAGNRRWVQERSTAGAARGAARRAKLSTSQAPFALVLGCSDSRLPAEIVFDQGLGDLFVVRTAGHVLDTAVLGSIEYAVAVLGVPLIVVLGHTGCGAVAAATGIVDGAPVPPGHIRDIAGHIAPNVLRARAAGAETATEISGHHSALTADLLRERSALVDAAVREGRLEIVPAQYDLCTGTVAEVSAQPTAAAAA